MPDLHADELATIRRTVVLDFDGTLARLRDIPPEGGPFTLDGIEPEPGALDAVRRLHAAGFRIVVSSTRNWGGYGLRRYTWLDEMCAWLQAHGIRDYVEIDAGDQGRVPGMAYIDDHGIRYQSGEWPAIVDWLLFQREVQ